MSAMKFSTLCIHGGEREIYGSVVFPLFLNSTFSQRNGKYVYSRVSNPTIENTEKRIALLEKTEDAALFSSGMGAISTTILTLAKRGSVLITHPDIYGGTSKLFNFLEKFGLTVKRFPVDEIREHASEADIIFLESITNPLVNIPDIKGIRRSFQGMLVVDNTFPSPYNFNPVDYGADVIVHSATKYLGGHSDLIAGVVAGDNDIIEKIKNTRKMEGTNLDPFTAYLLERSIKTLPVRMEKHNSNALEVAKFLEEHEKVERVYYPGLPSHPHHARGKKMMKGFGGVLSFDVAGDERGAKKFVNGLQLIKNAVSLGGVESLVTIPSEIIMKGLPQDQMGNITPRTVRLAIGIEDVEDLIDDISRALKDV
jgi:cystathionine gamma-synthase